ncbi:unnamed protein product [Larinioides sclopetarius]|uniref:RNase H type-1 domain-containing protein n=1 Tax=Larinioides sclopetarius TaxID=280406 RepID=A0AAV2BKF6_9ARAC
MEQGVGSAYCVSDERQEFIIDWQAKLHPKNSVFQAELVGIREAIKYASTTTIDTKIRSDSQASLKVIANTKTSPIARQIQNLLLKCNNVRLGWIKAHIRHVGNERADDLAKSAITSIEATTIKIPIPRSCLKRNLKEALSEWQTQWDDETRNGQTTHQVIPKVEGKSHNWPRQLIQFVTGHGPFPAYLHRFGIHPDSYCACGEEGTPFHYATSCHITASYHFTCPQDRTKQNG